MKPDAPDAPATEPLDGRPLPDVGRIAAVDYGAVRIDAATGNETPCDYEKDTLRTSSLPQWGIEGYLLTRQ